MRLGRRSAAERRRLGERRRRQLQPGRRRHLAGDAVDRLKQSGRLGSARARARPRSPAGSRCSGAPTIQCVRQRRRCRGSSPRSRAPARSSSCRRSRRRAGWPCELEAVLEHGAGSARRRRCRRPRSCGRRRRSAARRRWPRPDVDGAQAELVGVGVLLLGEHLADHEAAQVVRRRAARRPSRCPRPRCRSW